MLLANSIQNQENLSFFGLIISIFLILNALGQIPLFVSILAPYTVERQKKIIIRELLIALAILLLFNFFGNEILTLLGISRSIIGVTGGLLLLIVSLDMIFPSKKTSNGLPAHEPIVVPLAIPVIAGPGTITLVMIYAHKLQNDYLVASAIFLAWLPSLLILLVASYIKKFLGEKGLVAIERLGGMIVSLIGIQMFTKGVIDIVKENFF
jgi:MarC family membrane protein